MRPEHLVESYKHAIFRFQSYESVSEGNQYRVEIVGVFSTRITRFDDIVCVDSGKLTLDGKMTYMACCKVYMACIILDDILMNWKYTCS